ncbi:MAG: DinB family protein [Thermomicrobiales bacterium]
MHIAEMQTLYDYHYWATDHILRTAVHITDEQFTTPTRFPWGSLRGTLVHMLAAERYWVYVWQGIPPRPDPTREDYPTLAALRAQWPHDEAELRAYLATLTDNDLDRPHTYTLRDGAAVTAPLWARIVHVVTHGTLHRGEAAQMLTEFGHSPGDFDLADFLDERSG